MKKQKIKTEEEINPWKKATIVLAIFIVILLVEMTITENQKIKENLEQENLINLGKFNISEETLKSFIEVAIKNGWNNFSIGDSITGENVSLNIFMLDNGMVRYEIEK